MGRRWRRGCTAKCSNSERCMRKQNHVGNCWSRWFGADEYRYRYVWRRHGCRTKARAK